MMNSHNDFKRFSVPSVSSFLLLGLFVIDRVENYSMFLRFQLAITLTSCLPYLLLLFILFSAHKQNNVNVGDNNKVFSWH